MLILLLILVAAAQSIFVPRDLGQIAPPFRDESLRRSAEYIRSASYMMHEPIASEGSVVSGRITFPKLDNPQPVLLTYNHLGMLIDYSGCDLGFDEAHKLFVRCGNQTLPVY